MNDRFIITVYYVAQFLKPYNNNNNNNNFKFIY